MVCRGGDGTFCETLNGLMALEKRPEIGFIPAGTTNDIAHTLGLPTNPIKAAQLIVSSEALPYDIGLFGERYFTYVASFGAFTACAYKADQKLKNNRQARLLSRGDKDGQGYQRDPDALCHRRQGHRG